MITAHCRSELERQVYGHHDWLPAPVFMIDYFEPGLGISSRFNLKKQRSSKTEA